MTCSRSPTFHSRRDRQTASCCNDNRAQAFHARSGKAYLFHHAANVFTGPQEERMMTTGMHLVSDIFCVSCCSLIGWRYDFAYEKSQKYKEDKVILERSMVVRTYHGDDAPCELDSDASDDY
uniref:Protein yippee-like n=1 Tax=Chlamydomonas euryale TaxID=1486919 RepID=A0A7R9VRQ1_9CHLO|mmetsp:Transcript_42533/g.127561  ORF Transcript_42533/g.127561 Transcript_42533/m.127561 type:complete len:122 (+) Transcript_42533:378-743(+)